MHFSTRQRGIALLILLAIISMGVIFALVTGLNRSAGDLARARDQKTYAALAHAKEALIAYAVTYADDPTHAIRVPGFLPCPDLATPEGQAAGSCAGSLVSALGKLPWKTLGLDALKDGSGECLWYAVSGTYKNNPNGVSGITTTSNMMNWDTNGQFDVMDADGTTFLTGSTDDTNAVAVIFAPGAALAGQNRTPVAGTPACGGNYTAAAYLETANSINNSVVSGTASAQSPFIAGTKSDTFNDRLVYITRADIWNAIKKRSDFNNYLRALTRFAAECTAMYGTNNKHTYWPYSIDLSDKRLPWASNVSLSGTSVPTYAVNANYNDTVNLNTGRLSFKVNTAVAATSNNLSISIADYSTNSAYIFTNSSYCSYTADQKSWYENWKDQLFYAVAGGYDPGGSSSCGTCLKVKSGATTLAGSYAAAVIFAGEKLSGQNRNTATDKGAVANYLEGSSPASIIANTGGGASYPYQVYLSANFNDIVYAIDTSLAVKCYNGTAMVSVPAAAIAPSGDPAAYGACP